jgi:flagellar hook assembly protein FlgD
VFPNPFSTSVQIQFTQEKADNLYIYIYNDRGQLIRKFFNGQYVDRGRYVVYWDGTSEGGAPMSNGVYIYSIKIVSQLVKSGKLVLMK